MIRALIIVAALLGAASAYAADTCFNTTSGTACIDGKILAEIARCYSPSPMGTDAGGWTIPAPKGCEKLR